MTVVFAYTSVQNKASFIGADDLEGSGQRREEKCFFVLDRFLVAGVGNNIPLLAARFASHVGPEKVLFPSGEFYHPPNDIDGFIRQTCDLLAKIAPYQQKRLEDILAAGTCNQQQKVQIESSNGNLVVVDSVDMKMVYLEFGPILQPKESYEPVVRRLDSDRIYRFGINDPLSVGHPTSEVLATPFEWCEEVVRLARLDLEKLGFSNTIGDIGSCWLVSNEEVVHRTIETSIDDAIEKAFNK